MKSATSAVPARRMRNARLRTAISQLLLGAGTGVLGVVPVLAAEVEEIVVTDRQREAYTVDQSSLGKLTEALIDTPQSISVITEQLLDDRGAMSLNDALRNVPGITLGAGEFTWQGNNPTMRGFNSRNDMFLDGMRDYGSYSRDPFNLEAVEVLLGPSSMVFGRGSTGGVINQASKKPLSERLRKLNVNVGNADTVRISADVNQPLPSLGEGAALRLNAVSHEAGVPDRDGAETELYGIAPSLALQLGDATELTLSYMKQDSESRPDYGLPWISGVPANVDRETFYGFNDDFIDTEADISNISLDHQLADGLLLNAQLRYAEYSRASRISEPGVPAGVTASTPQNAVVVNRNVFNGESAEEMLQAQVNLIAEFDTGAVRHALVSGIEYAEESSSPMMRLAVGATPTTLLNPTNPDFAATRLQLRARANTDSDSLAAFMLDTIKFGDQWQVMAGVRWDHFFTNYIADRYDANGVTAGKEQVLRKDVELNYRAALVYKPVEQGTLYLGWGTSFNPSAEGLSFIANARNFGISNAFLEPEENRSIEFGVKWELLNQRLMAEAALFETTKTNTRVPDPTRPGFNALAGEQQVKGFSVNLSGGLTPALSVSGGYTYLDSEEAKTGPTLDNLGRPLPNVAENTFSVWFNYAVGVDLQLGAGARYIDERLARNTAPLPLLRAPEYWAFDAMAKYDVNDNLSIKANLTNLTDKLYYDQLHPFHVVPGAGLGAVLAVNFTY